MVPTELASSTQFSSEPASSRCGDLKKAAWESTEPWASTQRERRGYVWNLKGVPIIDVSLIIYCDQQCVGSSFFASWSPQGSTG